MFVLSVRRAPDQLTIAMGDVTTTRTGVVYGAVNTPTVDPVGRRNTVSFFSTASTSRFAAPSAVGSGVPPCSPRIAPTTVTARPSRPVAAENTKHPPPCGIQPVLIPSIPSVPRSAFTLYWIPATGRLTCDIATTLAYTGFVIAVSASRSWSTAVETVEGSTPLGPE